jgi:glycine/D-amino acid oxidase-like deaminating enzyme
VAGGKQDVVVIGGGITGTSAAYHLAKAGVQVTLVERHDLNTQASGRNAGGLHGQIQHEPFLRRGEEWAREFGPTLAVMRAAIRFWQTLERELGVDLEVNVSGGLIVAADDAQLRDLERKAAFDRAFGGEVELLDRAGLARVAPYVAEGMAGGLLCPLEGRANPLLATPALGRAAAALGARLLQGTEVTALERRNGGFRVGTTAGPIDCERVIDCAGVAAGEVAALAGAPFEVEKWAIMVSATEPAPPLIDHLVYFAGGLLTLKQARRGTVLIGGGWPARLEESTGRLLTDFAGLAQNLRSAIEVVPEVAGSSLLRTWQGVCAGLADERPAIGELVPGFIVALFPFIGFTCGPFTGKLAAGLVLGEEPELDLSPFAPSRLR